MLVAVARFTTAVATTMLIQDIVFSFSDNSGTTLHFLSTAKTRYVSIGFIEENYDDNCELSAEWTVAENSWLTVVVKYSRTSSVLEVRIGATTQTVTCSAPLPDKIYTKSFIGGSSEDGQYTEGKIAGLYVVDHPLNDTAIAQVVASIHADQDALQLCGPCPPGKYKTGEGVCVPCDTICEVGQTATGAISASVMTVQGQFAGSGI